MSNDNAKPRSEGERRDLYQEITNKVLALMEKGVNPFAPAWDGSKCPATPRPRNAVTGERYHGINEMLLGAQFDPRYCTYRQARAKNWQVRAGERSTPIIYFDRKEIENRNRQSDADPEKIVVPVARAYSVFHISQMDGPDGKPIPAWEPPTMAEAPWTAPDSIERIIDGAKAQGITFLEQGDKAFYSPSRDAVVTPPRVAFADAARFTETLLHEVGHASGASLPGRLNRQFGKRFADRAYSFEELVAEATSAFVASELNLNRGDLSHAASYLSSWADVLRADKRAIFMATARAGEAAEWVLKCHPVYRAAEEAKADRKVAPAEKPATYRLEGIDKANKDAVKSEYPPNTLRWNRADSAWEVRVDDPSVIAVVSKYGTQQARDELAASIDAQTARKQADAAKAPTSTGSSPSATAPRPIVATGVAAYGQMPKHIARRLGAAPEPDTATAPPPPSPDDVPAAGMRM
ncbi:MAG TPA: zincin-like metallopeptidase domain-containing protein [Patescibacteria group bacterium]|nr:zincin-like metallopeptidase domain-containing protein [Patescibacteria group bacterium]